MLSKYIEYENQNNYKVLENLIANYIKIIRNFEFDNINKEFEILIDNLKNDSNLKYFI